MRLEVILKHEFVEYVPDKLLEGTIYVSIPFATAVHRCCCGCGKEVVTPLSPTDWALTFDGESISFDPSIGNWNFPCQSHYWIKRNRVEWAPRWSRKEIDGGRAHDRSAKQKYYGAGKSRGDESPKLPARQPERKGVNLWSKIKDWWSKTLR